MINKNYQRWIRDAREEAMQEVIAVQEDGGYFNKHEDIFDRLWNICDSYMDYWTDPYRWLEFREAMWLAAYTIPSKIIIEWAGTPEDAYYLDHHRQERTEEIIKAEIGI